MESQPPPARPSIVKALDKVDEVVARLQQLQSTIAITRHAVSISPKCQPRPDVHAETNPSSAGEWKQWSAPAEMLYHTLCEIVEAAKSAKVEAPAQDELHQEFDGDADKEVAFEEPDMKVDEGGAIGMGNKSQLLDEVEQSKFVTKPATCMQVSKVKETKKAWKLAKDAVMFPNIAFSPSSPPARSKQFRILTPFKNAERAAKVQKVPLLGKKKREGSPVQSLPALIDRLPSKARPGFQKKAGAVAVAGNTSVLSRSKELPFPPSHYAQADKVKRESKRNARRKPAEPFKPREGNAAKTTKDGAALESRGRSGKQHYVKLSSAESEQAPSARSRSISPRRKRSDKENLLACDTGDMRRSWSAGSASSFGAKNNIAPHSVLQRAKGWVLGKQHAKGSSRL